MARRLVIDCDCCLRLLSARLKMAGTTASNFRREVKDAKPGKST